MGKSFNPTELRKIFDKYKDNKYRVCNNLDGRGRKLFIALFGVFTSRRLDHGTQMSIFFQKLNPSFNPGPPEAFNHFNRVDLPNVYKRLTNMKMNPQLIDIYLLYYSLYGCNDTEADEKINCNDIWIPYFKYINSFE